MTLSFFDLNTYFLSPNWNKTEHSVLVWTVSSTFFKIVCSISTCHSFGFFSTFGQKKMLISFLTIVKEIHLKRLEPKSSSLVSSFSETSSKSFGGYSTWVLANSFLAFFFLCFSANSRGLLSFLPWSPLWFKKRWMERSESDAPWPWSSAQMILDAFFGSFFPSVLGVAFSSLSMP